MSQQKLWQPTVGKGNLNLCVQAAKVLPENGKGYAIRVQGKVNINVFSKDTRMFFVWMQQEHYLYMQHPLNPAMYMLWTSKREAFKAARALKLSRKEYAHKTCKLTVVDNKNNAVSER